MNPIDPDQRQQRLSDYLDNRLGDAERAEIDRLIHDEDESGETELLAELNQMRFLRDSLKQLSARDARHQLDSGFADRVIEGAVRRAIEEGSSSDHPLIRLASQPGSSSSNPAASQNSRSRQRQILSVVVGLAASVALAVFVTRDNSQPGDLSTDQPLALAQSNLIETIDEGSALQPSATQSSSAPRSSSTAINDPTSGPDESADEISIVMTGDLEQPVEPKLASVAEPVAEASLAVASLGSKAIQSVASTPPSDRVADRAAVDSMVAMSQSVTPTKLSAIMVLEVKQTESGRVIGAVRRAMSQAGITRGDQKSLTDQIAESASQTVGLSEDELVSMVYLQASAKSIDQFYVNLFKDRSGVQSVSLAIATDAPVLEMVNAVDVVDATAVKSGAGSATLLSGEAEPLSALKFAEVSRDSMRGMAMSSGPDFVAQLIVVIR